MRFEIMKPVLSEHIAHHLHIFNFERSMMNDSYRKQISHMTKSYQKLLD